MTKFGYGSLIRHKVVTVSQNTEGGIIFIYQSKAPLPNWFEHH